MYRINEFGKIPFIRLVIPLILGLVTGLYLEISFALLVIIAGILILLFIVILFISKLSGRYKYRPEFGFCINIFIIAAGILLIKSKLNYSDKISSQVNSTGYYLCKVTNQPDRRSGTVKTLLKVIGYKDSINWYKCKASLQAYFQRDDKSDLLSYGDIIIIKTKIQEFRNLKNPCEFDYKRFMEQKGIRYKSYVKKGTWETVAHYNGLNTFAVKLRNKLLGIYRKYGIKDKEFAVLSAFTLGYRNELDPELKQAFISAGAMHFLAVSGLHVGIIFYVLNFLTGFSGKIQYGKSVRLILIILILWFYALLTGLSPPVLRAAAMFTLIQIGISFNRTINIYNILSVTAFLILIYNPLQISDPGFQFSFLAVLGIISFQPLFYKSLIFKNRILDKVWIISTVSVSAQLGVFPLIIYYYHHFPVYFWLTNILIIIPLALSMYLAIFLFVVYPVSQLAFIVAKILVLVLKLINFFIMTIEKLPASIIENIYINLTETFLLYLIIVNISMFAILKHPGYLKVSLLCIICFLSVNLYRYYKIYKQNEIIVFNINDHTAVNFIKGRNCY
ncbi:MAG: ComEC/Rec2 family competence protein, partial [Bacteroidales bacterium]